MSEYKANPDCHWCHGAGTVYDWVPYGMGEVQMPTPCECLSRDVDSTCEECEEEYLKEESEASEPERFCSDGCEYDWQKKHLEKEQE